MSNPLLRPAIRLISSAALVAGGLSAAIVAGDIAPAGATGPTPVCSSGTCTITYNTPEPGQSFTVPPGASSLSVTLYGGVGGTNYNSDVPGGDGAEVTATLAATPGDALGVDVGGAGAGGVDNTTEEGGANGGGIGFDGGAGGGASDVTSSGSFLVVAGGGGGAGNDGSDCFTPDISGGAGGNADDPGGNGGSSSVVGAGGEGGSPGTTGGPGQGGTGGQATTDFPEDRCGRTAYNGSNGAAGSGITGGSGSPDTFGGAGGGGYKGGGSGGGAASDEEYAGGAGGGGGGGGASYTGGAGVTNASIDDTGNSGNVNSGNGEVVFSYAVPAPVCSSGTCTVTYNSVGTGQSFTVPPGASSLSLSIYGGVGGTNYNSDVSGGDGSEVTATLAATPGDALGVDVGGAGGGGGDNASHAGGVNGGGAGFDGGGGGGASDVTSSGTLLVVAGGGGGAGQDGSDCNSTDLLGGPGGNADNPGGIGDSSAAGGGGEGGSPGTTAGPGQGGVRSYATASNPDPCGGTAYDGVNGAAGSGMTGGSGNSYTDGGGGGGGYNGGGSGGDAANDTEGYVGGNGGGGGGASYTGGAGVSSASIDDTGNSGNVNSGNGEVVFSYADPIRPGTPSYSDATGQTLSVGSASGLLSSSAGTSGPTGDTLTATGPADGSTAKGGTVSVDADGSFSYTPPSASFVGIDSFSYTVGDASGDYASGTARVQVDEPPSISSFSPKSGRPGTKVMIKGANLEGATKVTVDRVKAAIVSDTSTRIEIKIPAGAKTGKITVKTPNGTASSPTAFKVI